MKSRTVAAILSDPKYQHFGQLLAQHDRCEMVDPKHFNQPYHDRQCFINGKMVYFNKGQLNKKWKHINDFDPTINPMITNFDYNVYATILTNFLKNPTTKVKHGKYGRSPSIEGIFFYNKDGLFVFCEYDKYSNLEYSVIFHVGYQLSSNQKPYLINSEYPHIY
ncbi:MAG: hypothetical protein GF364_08150 [Candidatus Lokiarchaeota archaeon]|nr:hypothetical protein [Candidatus Lokiarchaeota archaeon]